MTIDSHTPFTPEQTPRPAPPWWTSRVDQIDAVLDSQVRRGEVVAVGRTSGGRVVRAVIWGEAEPPLRGPVNFNSALGARDEAHFVRRADRQRPVLLVLAGAHGQEVEGMVGSLSLISIMETGCDLTGAPQPQLRQACDRLRLIVIPLANPDGRARVPYEGLVGLTGAEMSRVGQGTHADGSNWGYPACKSIHPMAGDIGGLGGYFDDGGINLMHDEWFAPMSPLTSPLLAMVGREAPDILLNLHSHGDPPAILHLSYVPKQVQQRVHDFAQTLNRNYEAAGLACKDAPPVEHDGPEGIVPPAFNLTSACYHAGAALPVTFESPHGLSDGRVPFDYDDILRACHVLFQTAADALRP